MNSFSWVNIIYLIGVLLLISPMIARVMQAPMALRNATLWLAIIAGLAWGYHFFGDKLGENFATPTGYSNASEQSAATPAYTDAQPTPSEAPRAPAEDNPVRNQ